MRCLPSPEDWALFKTVPSCKTPTDTKYKQTRNIRMSYPNLNKIMSVSPCCTIALLHLHKLEVKKHHAYVLDYISSIFVPSTCHDSTDLLTLFEGHDIPVHVRCGLVVMWVWCGLVPFCLHHAFNKCFI